MVTSVITGDIIKSRDVSNPETWLTPLKGALSYIEQDTKYWEIYRGDSFQIEVKNPTRSFHACIYIKACIKMLKGLDVRLAIGVGSKTYDAPTITESNGEVFLYSGETLETLKKEKQNLRIKTPDPILNEELNLYFKLALIPMDTWTVSSAEAVKLALENPGATQQNLAKRLGINQNSVSQRQTRAKLDEILELDSMFREKIKKIL